MPPSRITHLVLHWLFCAFCINVVYTKALGIENHVSFSHTASGQGGLRAHFMLAYHSYLGP